MKYFIGFLLIIAFAAQSNAQSEPTPDLHLTSSSKKGKAYFHWGYNRAFYNRSDIHFKGTGFDFTMHNARAYDLHETWDPKVYLNITKLTIPQFNFRAGYFIKDGLSISLGWDHMKYVLTVPQRVRISGEITNEKSPYQGTFDNTTVLLTDDFIRYEHTDGFNFVRAGLEYSNPFWNSKNKKHSFNFLIGGSAGLALPWTDTYLFNERNRTYPHVAGFGFSGMAGLRFEFFKHFYAQWRAQYGFAHMTDILIENGTDGRAKQTIVFMERALVVGAFITIVKPE